MAVFIGVFLAKLVDIFPLACLILGLVKARWVHGLIVCVACAIASEALITQMRGSTSNHALLGLFLGFIACVLAFTIGKAIRKDLRN